MKRSLQFLTILSLFSVNISAQTSGNNHLLWRISGNGLSRPSYLFGTMHLTDKRLFYFGDSLYRALEQTEGFAAELDINALLTKYFENMLGENRPVSLVKDRADKALLKKNKAALESKFGKPVDEITMKDLENEESASRKSVLKSGEMKTFMDAYLMSLADRQGKWIGGIEDPEDQLGLDTAFTTEARITALLENDKKEMNLEWMTQVYLNEKLETIDRSNSLWKGAKDIILLRRNLKMAIRVDSLAHIRSCLFAVGAAHLPGDSGLVSLLRQKGFTVTPVISSKKIDPDKYQFKEVEKKWVDVWPRDSLYNVQMPAMPMPLKGIEDMPVDMLFYYDPVGTTAYFTAYLPIAGATKAVKDSVMRNLIRYYKSTTTEFEEKDIMIMGKPGKEALMEANGGAGRMQVIVADNYVVMNMVAGLKKEALFSKNSDRFLNSFKPDSVRSAKFASAKAQGWRKYSYVQDGFSIQSPVKLKRTVPTGEAADSWRRVTFEGPDVAGQSYYLIAADAIAPGYYAEGDSTYILGTKKWVEEEAGTLISSGPSGNGEVNGYEIVFKPKGAGASYITRVFLVDKANRRYSLYRTYDTTLQQSATGDLFFRSFHLLEPSFNQWKMEKLNDGFSAFIPSSLPVRDTSDKGSITYSFYDSLTAASFTVAKFTMPDYYWAKSASDFFESRIQNFYSSNDSILQKVMVKNGELPGMDMVVRLGQGPVYKKVRLLLNGDTLYTLFAFLPEDYIQTDVYKKFFSEFRPTHIGGESAMFRNKPEDLLQRLISGDSTTFENAKNVIGEAPFSVEDIPLLQRALLSLYRDFDSATFYWGGIVNNEIRRKLIELDSTGQNISFVKKHYHELQGAWAYIRFDLLCLLSSQHTSASYDLLKELLKDPMPPFTGYTYLTGLDDSLKLSGKLFPEAFNPMFAGTMVNQLSGLTVTLLDSNLIDLKMIRGQEGRLHILADRLTTMNKEQLESNSYSYLPVIELITRLRDKKSNQLLHNLTKVKSTDICEAAILGLLENGESVSVKEVMPLAKSDEYRKSIYDRLEKAGKLNVFPSEYATQRWMAQSEIFSYAYDDEELPVVTFIKEKAVQYEGKMKRFYLFKVGYGEEDAENTYLGVAGPYSLNRKDLRTGKEEMGVYWKEPFDPKNVDALFKDFLDYKAPTAAEDEED